MSNRVIKISIVLIFMLFVTGLFNFCFAYTVNNDFELVNTITSYDVTVRHFDCVVPLYKAKFSYPECPTNHKYKVYCIKVDYLRCYVSDKPIIFDCTSTDRIYQRILEDDGSHSLPYIDSYRFDNDTGEWVYESNTNGNGNVNIPYEDNTTVSYLLTDYTQPVLYGYASAGNKDLVQLYPEPGPSIDMKVVQTGTRTGHVEFTKVNWDSPHMYYIKDDMDELVRLIAEEELSITHEKVKHYDGPVDIEYGEYVMGLLFDDDGNMCFSEISDTVTIDYDSITDNTHKLYVNKEDENTYFLSIHGYQEGDYLKVSDVSNTNDAFNMTSHCKTLNTNSSTLEFNGLFIGQAYDTALGHKNRKVNLNKNGITYFYLYDKDNNLINSAVINSSNYYSGEEFNFDVELQFGSSLDDNLHLTSDEIRWVKVKPIIDVPSVDNYELYLRISDYGNIPYIQEEDRCIFATHDTNGSNYLGVDIGTNSNTNWHRIDDKIYDYFYINTLTHDSTFTFELQLRSGSGQIIQTKSFKVNLSSSSKVQGTVSSTTDGKDDTYIRNPDELSGNISTSNKYDFSGLNDLSELDLQNNVNGLIDNSVGFFSLISTFLLLLPNWISALLYLFFFGIIVITLLRFIRGS